MKINLYNSLTNAKVRVVYNCKNETYRLETITIGDEEWELVIQVNCVGNTARKDLILRLILYKLCKLLELGYHFTNLCIE